MSWKQKNHDALKDRLVKGEKVVVNGHIHPAIYWPTAAVFMLGILIAVLVVKEIGLLLITVSILMGIHTVIKSEILMIVVTNKRVLARYGILQVDVVDLHFDKIESVELERMLPGFLFGYANVVVMGTGNRYIVIPYVANALAIRKAYNAQVLEEEEEE